MCSNSTETIDDLALAVEHIIAQNEAALTQHNEEYTSLSEHQSSQDSSADPTESRGMGLFG